MNSVITTEDCFKIINKISRDFQFVSLKIIPFDGEPLGFNGGHSRLQIFVNNNNQHHVLQFFLKTVPSGMKSHEDYIIHGGIFKKETMLFDELFGKFQLLVKGKFAPLSFLVKIDSCIVMEDLSLQGFSVFKNKLEYFDLLHCKCVIETVASFHAACIIFEEQNSTKNNPLRIYDHYKHMLYETTLSFEKGHPRNDWLKNSLQTLIDLTQKIKKYKNTKFIDGLEKLGNDMKMFIAPSNKYKNVIIHGDLWCNNIMFKYDENNLPKECVLVDLQMVRYVPPCYDFIMFLYLTTTKEFHEKHFQELVDIYYNTFTLELKRHNLNADDILSKNEFVESCKFYKPAALLESCMFGTITYLNVEFSINLMKNEDAFFEFFLKNRSKYVCKVFDEDPVFKSRITSLLDQLLTSVL